MSILPSEDIQVSRIWVGEINEGKKIKNTKNLVVSFPKKNGAFSQGLESNL